MMKLKLKRFEVENFFVACQVVKQLDIPAKFRYALAKNTQSLTPEIKALEEAFPRPDASDKKAVKSWEEDKVRLEHMQGEVEVEIYQTPLVEINDTVHVDEARRPAQNQALIEALMPMWEE